MLEMADVVWLQVFDRQGDFLFRIGSVGKHDGALVYPNRVAVCRLTGNVVITERSPTHQVLMLFMSKPCLSSVCQYHFNVAHTFFTMMTLMYYQPQSAWFQLCYFGHIQFVDKTVATVSSCD